MALGAIPKGWETIPEPEPAAEAERIFFLALFGTEMVQEGLDVLLHVIAKFLDDRFLQLEQIEGIMPTPVVGSADGVFGVRHECVGELFQAGIEMQRTVFALVDPSGEERKDADFDWRRGIGGDGR